MSKRPEAVLKLVRNAGLLVLIFGPHACSEIGQDDRVRTLEATAEKHCALLETQHGDAEAAGQCLETVAAMAQQAEDWNFITARSWMGFAGNRTGDENYAQFLYAVDVGLPQIVSDFVRQSGGYDQIVGDIRSGINTYSNGTIRPFAGTRIGIGIHSLTPVQNAQGQQTPFLTGNLTLTIIDRDGQATRTINFDSVTGRVVFTHSAPNMQEKVLEFFYPSWGEVMGLRGSAQTYTADTLTARQMVDAMHLSLRGLSTDRRSTLLALVDRANDLGTPLAQLGNDFPEMYVELGKHDKGDRERFTSDEDPGLEYNVPFYTDTARFGFHGHAPIIPPAPAGE